ncbi:MAG: type II secretion system F family protein, partial [Beijerinckiaceae bacterium]
MTDWIKDLPEGWPLVLGAALVAVLVAESAYLLFFNAKRYRDNVNRRLEIQKEGRSREEALVQLRKERGVDESGASTLGKLQTRITQSGLRISVQQLLLGWAACMAVLPAIAYVVGRSGPIDLAVALGIGAIIPPLVLNMVRARRIKKFSEQFPDAIDVIVRSLKAGHPLAIAISLVAREMPDPVGTEFGMVADEMSFGLDLETAMRNLYLRVGQDDLPLFVTSVSIQAATGGNLAAILEGLSQLIRDRFRMRRKIKALSSEARFSAYVLISLPFILYLLIGARSAHRLR